MTFKTQTEGEISVFFNTDELAEIATYEGVEINVVESEVSERNTGVPGFTIPVYSVFVQESDVSHPKAGDAVTFRGVSCTVGPYPQSESGIWLIDLFKDTIQA